MPADNLHRARLVPVNLHLAANPTGDKSLLFVNNTTTLSEG